MCRDGLVDLPEVSERCATFLVAKTVLRQPDVRGEGREGRNECNPRGCTTYLAAER
jgi:hypothetical protein